MKEQPTRETISQMRPVRGRDDGAALSPGFLCDPIPEWMFGDSEKSRNALQNSGRVHPLTCGNTDCREATNQAPLLAVEGGWKCDYCGYTQPQKPRKT